jgi:hypothetical protein
MVLLSAQGMSIGQIAKVALTSEDRVRDVIHNFNADGFDSLYPKYDACGCRISCHLMRPGSIRVGDHRAGLFE